MSTFVVPLIAVVAVLAIGWFMARAWGKQQRRAADELADPATPTLEYSVPEGQDPAILINALSDDGFTANVDPADTMVIHVACPSGTERDRAHVRAVIASVHSTVIDSGAPFDPGDVRFRDEEPLD